ncbi:hypothetical protein RchiOBHm_Chr6g0284841 [Rosa chinensis]|uniref:Niemann-Pick C1 N-terminal domain-containing protein n=1 Tax=Rosa chinensis TaxID=74649 RepID=A0A2P6PUI0_ROSCH|nr:hypothetical protein RchiOBHm_Chr6g0284841 [Rosa chinensis]
MYYFFFCCVSGNMTVAGIDYYISDTFGQGLHNSCKDVKFRSVDLVGAGAKSFEEWFDFLGKKA